MNILFIEDEKELARTAATQLEARGYEVDVVYDLAAAREVMEDPNKPVDLIIADHRLPDGMGIQFGIEMKTAFPESKCVIVSGCLTPTDIQKMEEHGLRYFDKPLLYGQLVDELRRSYSMQAPVRTEPLEETEAEAAADPEEVIPDEPEPKKKKFFGLFGKKKKGEE
jgi:DNA-binding NtrC family response regulator